MAVYDINGNIISSSSAKSKGISPVFFENQLIAHKGGNSGTANTISNYESAISNGYKMVECDVRFTSDKIAVLSHDASFTVDGTSYTIASNTYADLVAVKPTLATLEELLILCKKNGVVVEIDFSKTYTNEQCSILYGLLAKYAMCQKAMITSYAVPIRYLLGIDPNLIVCVSGVSTTSGVDAVSDIINTAVLTGVSTEYSVSFTQAFVEYVHTAGAFSKPWTVNNSTTIGTLFDYGCDYIITDSVLPSSL